MALQLLLCDGLTKVFDPLALPRMGEEVSLCLARGDREDFQMFVLCDEATEGTFTLPAECSLYRQVYAKSVDGKEMPDALVPTHPERVPLAAGLNAFWVTFATTAEFVAGEYTYSLALTTAEDVLRATLFVRVWDLSLEHPYCESNTGIGMGDLAAALGVDAANEETAALLKDTYRTFYEFLVSYGFCPSGLPYELGDPRAEVYLNDARVTSFVLPWNASEEQLSQWSRILLEHPAWSRKAMFYPVDEPMTQTHLNTLKERAERLRRLFPQATVVTPLHRDVQVDEERDSFEFLKGVTDLWCPKAALFSDYIYSEEQKTKYAPIAERMRERKKNGERLWWYVCCEPAAPYANVHMDLPLIEARTLFWQQSLYDVDGFLYWSATYWRNTEDPFVSAPHYLMGADKIPVYGDGVLCYMGKGGEPIPSIRLMALSSGMRDFALLERLKLSDERAYAEILGAVCRSVTDHTHSTHEFSKARKALYQALAEDSQKETV